MRAEGSDKPRTGLRRWAWECPVWVGTHSAASPTPPCRLGGPVRVSGWIWGVRESRLSSRIGPHLADLDGEVPEHIPTDVWQYPWAGERPSGGRDALRCVRNFFREAGRSCDLVGWVWGFRESRLSSWIGPHPADLDGDVTEHIPTVFFQSVSANPCRLV